MAIPFFFYPIIYLTLHIFTNHFLHKIRNLPPTPFPSLPLIGQFHLLKRPLHRTLTEISRRYGPILFLRFGSRPVLVVSSPSAAEDCLSKNDPVFANRPRLIGGKYFGYNYTSLIWAPYGDHWRNLRRISSMEIFSTHRLQALAGIRQDEVQTLIRKLRSNAKNDAVDMRKELFEFMFNVMMRMMAGKKYYGEDAAESGRFREIQEETFRLSGKMNLGDFIRVLKWVGFYGGIEQSIRDLHRKRDVWMQGLIEEHRNSTNGKN